VQNPVARRSTYTFLKDNWSTIEARFSRGSISLLSSIVAASTGTLTTLEDAADIRAFFADKDTAAFSRTIEQSIEKITLHAKWLARDATPVAEWLKNQ
jgi:aminopeptidase 2